MDQQREPQRARTDEGEGLAGEGQVGLDPAEIVHAASEFARENPHAALAGALAVGFLLGGGLTPRLALSLVTYLGRRYVAEVAQGTLETAVR
jgi:hypothetical protein